MPDSLDDLTRRLRDFAAEREWDRFHTPKNLAMALTGEAGELAAEFQWLTTEESLAPEAARLERVRQEAADVLLYLARLADKLGFDLIEAAQAKMALNAQRYPPHQARGNARKYTEFS
jgi:NTP pyrophosphatase (non-canonical NTP hydrolase)